MVNIIDEEVAAQRNHAMRNHLSPPPPPFPKLEHGVLHREADGTVAPVTGSLSVQGRLRKGALEGRGDDVLGHGFQLISRAAPQLEPGQLDVLSAIGCGTAVLDDPAHADAVDDADGVYRAFLDEQGVDAYITRPDWYVFGAVQADQLADLVDELGELLHVRVRPTVSA